MNLEKLQLEKLKALADETRLEILGLLRHGGELCACDLEKMLDKSQSTISRHLKKLELAGIIESRKEGVKVMYKIRDLHVYKLFAVLDQIIKREKKYKKILQIQENI
ncbi:MAG: ArsR/SmtB family transcription factor [Promethearchaeota archaeon]